jgi:4-hydroxy-L-threonine phosphate dehydrogenase PdxA
MKRIVFTCGDINGIGPEIALKALNKITSIKKDVQFILIIPENVFKKASLLIRPLFNYQIVRDLGFKNNKPSKVNIFVTKSFRQNIGKSTVASGKAAYLALKYHLIIK